MWSLCYVFVVITAYLIHQSQNLKLVENKNQTFPPLIQHLSKCPLDNFRYLSTND